jgi:hypothetical protein
VIGGGNITATQDDTVYVDNLNIRTLGGGTSINNLGVDASGNVVTGTTGGSTDNYVTGATMVGDTLVLNRTDALSAATVDLSQFGDVFVDTYTSGRIPRWSPSGTGFLSTGAIRDNGGGRIGVNGNASTSPTTTIRVLVSNADQYGLGVFGGTQTGNGTNAGIYSESVNTGTGTKYGGIFRANTISSDPTTNCYGVYGYGSTVSALSLPADYQIGGVFRGGKLSTGFTDSIGVYAEAVEDQVTDNYGIIVNASNATGGAYIGKFTDGTEGAGKVLTSDANGVATWQTPTGGGGVSEATSATTTTVSFTGQTIYYDAGSPTSGTTIGEDLTGAKLGVIQKIYSNASSEPSYPAGWVLMGDGIYFTSILNIIYAEWAGGSRVEYWYVQEQ